MHWPSWLMWYKKPEYRDIKEYSNAVNTGRRPLSPDGRGKTTIPSRLKLERVLQNKTCSPMSLYDFYMYLKYIEYSAENLEFYVWFKTYEAAYQKSGSLGGKDDRSLSGSDSTLSLANEKDEDPEFARETLARIAQLISVDAQCSSGLCQIGPIPMANGDCITADGKPCDGGDACTRADGSCRRAANSTLNLISDAARGPRAELDAVINMFLMPGSEKELNIPPMLREQALHNLRTSCNPIHLKPVADHVYLLLRNCSHRNFVRLGVSNGTFETVCVATGLGIVLTVTGFLTMLLLALTPHIGARSRWVSFAPWPMWWLGMSLILSGLRGSCFFLLLFSRRQPLPWERFDDSASVMTSRIKRNPIIKVLSRLMIFDRKFKVKDVHLRRLQYKIVLQSLIMGAVFASCGVLLFVFLPVWSQTYQQ